MYIVTYKDNTQYKGGCPQNSKWSEVNRPIQQLEYSVGNKTVVMKDYERYNHLVEWVSILGKKRQMTKIILMGLEGNVVTKIIFDIKKCNIRREVAKLGYEYNGGLTTGWKTGVSGKIPSFLVK